METKHSRLREMGWAVMALFIACAIWLPNVHRFYLDGSALSTRGVSPRARLLAERHLTIWHDDALREQEFERMRGRNAEWDFMGRTFLVLALSNMALREPASTSELLAVIDAIIDDTLEVEATRGMYHFLMGYAQGAAWVQKPDRSIFVDGEIALMLGARRLVEENADYQTLFLERTELMSRRLQAAPVLCNESYPNECWMFCNAAALAALRMADVLDGSDHGRFFQMWIERVQAELVDRGTGLLPSSFTLAGKTLDGPEGSSIWFAAHCLQVIDEPFARDQYARAKSELAMSLGGFGYAREWPPSFRGAMDVDSGPVIPVLDMSAGSSGMAFIGAAAFEDSEFLSALLATIDFAAFPLERDGGLRYCASNQVGDAVLLYALVMGPLWEKIQRGGDGD